MVNKAEYLKNPCGESSIPYWKTKAISVPAGMKILHETEFDKLKFHETDSYEAEASQFVDEPYFRLSHDLKTIAKPLLPQEYSLCDAVPNDFAEHINRCYDGICISEAELQNYLNRPTYASSLWLAVRDNKTGDIAATGIAELDREIGEGILEWIQVSKHHRRFGLGSYLVCELLWRMKDIARFATVSGQCNNPANPEGLYRKCGFTGNDVWHVLRKKG